MRAHRETQWPMVKKEKEKKKIAVDCMLGKLELNYACYLGLENAS